MSQQATHFVLARIRSGAQVVTAAEVERHLAQLNPAVPLAAHRTHAIQTLRAFSSIGVGRYKTGRRGWETRLEHIP